MRMQSMSPAVIPVKAPAAPVITGSGEQQAIWREMIDGTGNLLVNAVAGSGKSTTCIEGARKIKAQSGLTRVLYLAFNRAIKEEMAARSDDSVTALTYHALGNAVVTKALGAVKVDNRRMWPLIQGMRPWSEAELPLRASVKKLCELAKQYDADTPEELSHLIDYHGLDCGNQSEQDLVVSLVPVALKKASEFVFGQVAVIDYDDMCWLPVRLDLKIPRVDMALSDESQDLNHVQMWLATRAADRLMIVGDRNQAIYGFRGSDVHSMDNLAAMCSSQPVEYQLSYTRRCPLSHVRLAQRVVPGIHALPSAIEGTTGLTNIGQLLSGAEPGDMILCRTNAPLVETAHKFMARGIPVVIKGKDIGASIVRLLTHACESRSSTLPQALTNARTITDRDVARFLLMRGQTGEMRAVQAEDKLTCLLTAAEGCSSVTQLKDKLLTMFSDDLTDGKDKIILSTIHRAKGLEADCVWILKPELLPHPMAKKPHEIEQELNCLYVALTRSRSDLYFVGGYPAPLFCN